MTFNELREARQQPVCSETRDHTDDQDPVPVARPNRLDPFGDFADSGPHSFQEPASLVGQRHTSAAAPEKRRSQMLFQTLDALAHRAVGDVHLLRGVREIQVSGSRLEEAKRLERRKVARHAEMIAALTADAKNHRWQSSHQRSIIHAAEDDILAFPQANPTEGSPHDEERPMPQTLTINGKARSADVDDDTPLLWVLRDVLGMTGTKFGCGMALCGACTIHVDGAPTRSCITPIDSLGSSEITTIEAIGKTAAGAKVQKAWLDREVPQCGYCQSGQIMSASALLASNPRPTDSDIDDAMSGNICRCGTYVRIREAIKQAAQSSGQGG